MLKILPTLLLLLLTPTLLAQVLAKHPFATELARALALEAGAAATDVPHHVHYDLQLFDRHHKLTKGTWDIWRDPLHFVRTDMEAGDYHYIHIEDLAGHREWRHFNGILPLKLYDLRQNYEKPEEAVELFGNHRLEPNAMVSFDEVGGSPFNCTEEVLSMRICFDPLAHVLAFAQIMNQTITWEDWQTLGKHSVPRRFRIYDGERMIIEASGKADEVKTFPKNLFVIPKDEPDMGDPEVIHESPHAIIGSKPVDMDLLYGNALIHLFVDAEGKVTKMEVVDADDDNLIGGVKHFAKHLRFAPQLKDGVPVPFDDYMYFRHALNFQDASVKAP